MEKSQDKTEFDFGAAVSEIERLVAAVENPQTGVEDAEKMSRDARELLAKCRAHLRRSDIQ